MSHLGIIVSAASSVRFFVARNYNVNDSRTYALSIIDSDTGKEHCPVTGYIKYKNETEKRAAYVCACLNDREASE